MNNLGFGTTFSNTLAITADAVSTKTNAPVIAAADILPYSVKMTWTAITFIEAGNDAVLFYLVEWD